MAVIASAFTNGYGSTPVISGAAAINEIPVASGATAASWQLGFLQQATTTAAGYTLVNASSTTILTWTAPNDGNMHRVHLWIVKRVTVNEVGGSVTVNYTLPDSTAITTQIDAGGNTAGTVEIFAQPWNYIVKAGTAFTLTQLGALTGGASKAYAEIWAS